LREELANTKYILNIFGGDISRYDLVNF
jgi:hypothetical protein